MSDSAPKQRSFLAAYGPLIAIGGVLALVSIVLFSMSAKDVPGVPNPDATPKAKVVVAKQVIMDRIKRLVASGKKSWDDLTPQEQSQLDTDTNGQGEMIYNFGAQKIAEDARNAKSGKKSSDRAPDGTLIVSTPPPPVKTN